MKTALQIDWGIRHINTNPSLLFFVRIATPFTSSSSPSAEFNWAPTLGVSGATTEAIGMGYKVYYSNPGKTATAGFGLVARLPCIFDSRPGYHRMGSRYLIELGLGDWPKPRALAKLLLTDQSMKNAAEWLANFLEWADVNETDPATCTYIRDVING